MKTDAWKGSDVEAKQVARIIGLDQNLYLPTACADFYVLERLWADGYKPAAELLSTFEKHLARQFSTYIGIACGGELRHITNHLIGSEEYYCSEVGCMCMAGREHDCAALGHHTTNNCQCQCDNVTSLICHANISQWKPCHSCTLYHCYENGDYEDIECACGDCPACGGSGDPDFEIEQLTSHSGVLAFFDQMKQDMGPRGKLYKYERNLGWAEWHRLRIKHGSTMMRECMKLLDHEVWGNGSFGGPRWAMCARLVADWEEGRISDRIMVNMALSMQHNNGIVFDKLYTIQDDIPSLRRTLDTQADDDYEKLAAWCSPTVKEMWHGAIRKRKTAMFHDHDPVWVGKQQLIPELGW